MTPDALVIPLGKAAQDAVSLLAADGLLNPGRSLTGFLHPSGVTDTGFASTRPTVRR